MSWKLEAVLCFTIVVVVSCVLAAPKNIHSEKDLIHAFEAFLKDDKESIAALEKSYFGDHLRNRRDADMSVDGVELGQPEEEQQPGFFDRAAKFVMELLQKFLKWINTDSN